MTKIDAPGQPTTSVPLSDSDLTAFFRTFLPDFYFVNTPISRMRRHLELLERLPAEKIILNFHQFPDSNFTELTLCAYDDDEPGLLTKIAGTLAALKINVHTAWIHTMKEPGAQRSNRRLVLNTFLLSEPYFKRSRPLTKRTSAKIASQIKGCLAGNRDWEPRSGLVRHPFAPIIIHELTATPAPGQGALIKLRAQDSNGVLYGIANALATLHLNIAHAQINTYDHSVEDLFFVNTPTKKPTKKEAAVLGERLLAALQNVGA